MVGAQAGPMEEYWSLAYGNNMVFTYIVHNRVPLFKFLVYVISVYVSTLAYYISYFFVGMIEYYDHGT